MAWRQPGNPLGWIFLALTALLLLGGIGADYTWLSYQLGHHLPLAVVGVFLGPTWVWLFVTLPLVMGLILPVLALFWLTFVASHGACLAPRGRRAPPAAQVADEWCGRVHGRPGGHRHSGNPRPSKVAVTRPLGGGLHRDYRHRGAAGVDRGGDPEVPAVRHRPDHLPDPGVRDCHRAAGRGVRGPGAAGYPGPFVAQHGGGRRRHAGRRGTVQPAAAAGAAAGGPAVPSGPVRCRPDGGRIHGAAEGHRGSGFGPR